ncbi:MAG: GIY-YIG nuclease family protein [Brachymonas sp.]|nr:GIY-YIG nuclease family protein [Brachymonas sp.]
MQNSAALQIVYVLTNPAMPGLVKIGSTTQEEVDVRMKQLFSSGVPVPFDCVFACRVLDAMKVEKALHHAFGQMRINPTREFFRIEPERVISILKLLHTEVVDDVTAQVERTIEAEATQADLQAAEHLKQARRPRMDYVQIGVPIGSVLVYEDGSAQATVQSTRTVLFDGKECSLTAATRKVRQLPEDYPLQPSPYWTYNGQTLKEIYEAFYAGQESDA